MLGRSALGARAVSPRISKAVAESKGRPNCFVSFALARSTFGQGVSSKWFDKPWTPGVTRAGAPPRLDTNHSESLSPTSKLKPL